MFVGGFFLPNEIHNQLKNEISECKELLKKFVNKEVVTFMKNFCYSNLPMKFKRFMLRIK